MKWEEVGLVLESMDLDGVSITLRRSDNGAWCVDVYAPGAVWVSIEGDLPSALEDAARAARGEPDIVLPAQIADLTRRLNTAVRALRRLSNEPCKADEIVWNDSRSELSRRLETAVNELRQLPEEPSYAELLDAGLDALLAASGFEDLP